MRHTIAQRFYLPSICILCNQYHQGGVAICSDCKRHMSPLGPACEQCALPLPESQHLICGHCIKEKPIYDRVISAYRFEEPLRTLLHEFKYKEGLYLLSFLTSLMHQAILDKSHDTECFIPIPMHPHRLRQRGFNQSALLTKQLAHTLRRPYHVSCCKKIINTRPQAELNAQERQTNLQSAFEAMPLPYKKVTLVDDLLTTGSTANALAGVLKSRGVEYVDIVCCARAV